MLEWECQDMQGQKVGTFARDDVNLQRNRLILIKGTGNGEKRFQIFEVVWEKSIIRGFLN
ncbi:hypothetical protein BH09PAT1_BH09PAT1_6880 [soil metagenome]